MAAALGCGGPGSLEASETKEELIDFTGSDPGRCVYSAPDLELCTWQLGEGDPVWAGLSESLGTQGELNLICELPIDGSARSDGSCVTLVRGLAETASGQLPPVSAQAVPGSTAAARRQATQRLAIATTVRELSELLGDAPNACKTGLGVQTCEWNLAEPSGGRSLLAAMASGVGPMQLSCVLPLDGSARKADSCQATELD